MADPLSCSVQLCVGRGELPDERRIWGTGGWLAPEAREALDWLTLCRLLGWEVRIQRVDQPAPSRSARSCCIVIACDPAVLSDSYLEWLHAQLAAAAVLVVVRAGTDSEKLQRLCSIRAANEPITGHELIWRGPEAERRWRCHQPLVARPLTTTTADQEIWTTIDGVPVIASAAVGRGRVAVLGFHPSSARDSAGAISALLMQLLICGAQVPVAWFDYRNTMVLRMDDPGGAQNIYNRAWCHRKLQPLEWQTIGAELARRKARLSIAYSVGWVDDGDAARGILTVDGQPVERIAGSVHDSPLITYRDIAGYAPGTVHDYTAEYRAIQELRRAGWAEIEMHGYTHMHPDTHAWARAEDRYDAVPWFRELGKNTRTFMRDLPAEKHPLARACAALRKYFATSPTTLIAPGEEFDEDAQEKALQLGLELFGSYYLGMRYENRFCWAQHICAPYLDEPDASWFDSELPVVGYFHDRDLVLGGVEWLRLALDRWQQLGATRLIDYRELAAANCHRLRLDQVDRSLQLIIDSRRATPMPKAPLIRLRATNGSVPKAVEVIAAYGAFAAAVEWESETRFGQLCWPGMATV